MKQSRTMSLVEATANVIVGYVLAIATQIVVFPSFGIATGLAEHLTIGLAFVGVSLVRGPVAVWCRSFDSILCSKGDELWDKHGRTNFVRTQCA